MGMFKRSARDGEPAVLESGYRSTVFFPDAAIIADSVSHAADADLPAVGAQGKIHQTITIDGDDYLLDATARGGCVLMSIWAGDVIVTSVAVVSGAEPENDTMILNLFVSSTLGTDLVKHLTAGVTAPFAEMLSTTQRPFCATVLIPQASTEATESVLDWQSRWVGAHLDAVLSRS